MESDSSVKQTYIYKTHLSTDLQLDVYPPPNSQRPQKPKPVLLWFHGGYLITGSRIAIPQWLLHYAREQSWTIVSPDYRVLPESTGLEILEDLISAYEWVAHTLPGLHPECEGGEIILAGASAGGWCALITALHFCPTTTAAAQELNTKPRPKPPKALWLLYPMLDLGSEKWASSVSLPGSHVKPETARALILDIPQKITRGEVSVGEDFPSSEEEVRTRKRLPLLYAILQSGTYLDHLTGVNGFAAQLPSAGLESVVESCGEQLKPLFPLNWGVLHSDPSGFPVTFVVHGTADEEVSSRESETLVAMLSGKEARAEYFLIQGAGHVFDLELHEVREEDGKEESAVLGRALGALQKYLDE